MFTQSISEFGICRMKEQTALCSLFNPFHHHSRLWSMLSAWATGDYGGERVSVRTTFDSLKEIVPANGEQLKNYTQK